MARNSAILNDEQKVLHHDPDLLRQCASAHRARLHHDCLRHDRPPPPHAGRRHLVPHRNRRARAEDRARRPGGRQDVHNNLPMKYRVPSAPAGIVSDFPTTISSAPLPTVTSKACRRCGGRFATTATSTREPTPASIASSMNCTSMRNRALPVRIVGVRLRPSTKKTTTSSFPPSRTS